MARTRMSHITHMNESCHTHGWVMSHTHITAHIAGAVPIGVTTGVFDRYTFSNVRLLLNLLSNMTIKLREIRAMAIGVTTGVFDRWKFSYCISTLNLLGKRTMQLTFEKFQQWRTACRCAHLPRASRSCLYPYGIVLQCFAVCCSVLQCVPLHVYTYMSVCVCVFVCLVLPGLACTHTVLCCSVLQCFVVCLSVLQCVPLYVHTYLCVCVCVCVSVPRASRSCLYPHGIIVSQCVAVRCSVLRCVAVRCSVLGARGLSNLNARHTYQLLITLTNHKQI